MANVLKKLDKPQEANEEFNLAITMYQKQLDRTPDSTHILVNLGESLTQAGEPEQALGYYEQALALDPLDVKTHEKLITALQLSGAVEKALDTARTSIEFFTRMNKTQDVQLLKTLTEHLKSQDNTG